LRVLVSAYACEPGKGSEPGGGWNWVRQIGRFHECWVITRLSNREEIDNELAVNPIPRAHFVYYDLPRWARFWKKGTRGVRSYYYLWQFGAYRLARGLHREVQFNLVHHLTFASYCLPSFLSLLPAPFLWGPVGGGETAPPRFQRSFGLRATLFEALRTFAQDLAKLNPFVRMTARQAVRGLAATPQTARRLESLGCRNVSLSSQVVLSLEEISMLRKFSVRKEGPFRVISVGRFLHWKGFELGIRAFAAFHRRHPESEYWIIGDGPEKERWKRVAEDLGAGESIVFRETIPRPEVLEQIASCDVLLHPSLHDSGGWVTAEAMAAGRPVICLDLGGPALQVTEETGIKIRAIAPDQAAADITTALEHILGDSLHRARLGEAGRTRIERHFSSDRLGGELAALYRELAGT
jgi:glycosyltransferase involved in cell wall biosynthesis